MAEPISIQQLKDASEDAITLADFIYKPANVMIPRRLAADINSLQYYLDYMSSYAQHSYETYDEMVANAPNLSENVSVFVTNDLDTSKNGIYTYNGTSFVKGEYQPENAAKDFVEAKLGGLEVFDGKVRAQDVSTVDGSTQDVKNLEFRNELNALPFDNGVLSDTYVETSIDALGAISRKQKDKNSDILFVEDFGAKPAPFDSTLAFNLALGLGVQVDTRSGVEYQLSDTITIKSGSSLNFGSGVKIISSLTNKTLFNLLGEGTSINGNGAQIISPEVFIGTQGVPTYGVVQLNANSCTVTGLRFKNYHRFAIQIKDTTHHSITNNEFDGNVPYSFYSEGDSSTLSRGAIHYDNPSISIADASIDISGNRFKNDVQGCMAGNFGSTGNPRGIKVRGNHFYNMYDHAIYFDGISADGCLISSNTFLDCRRPIVAGGNGSSIIGNSFIGVTNTIWFEQYISLRDPKGCIVSDNTFSGHGAGIALAGIIGTEITGNVISNNTFKQTASSSFNSVIRLYNTTTVEDNIITDNIISGYPKSFFGAIDIDSATIGISNTISNNKVKVLGQGGYALRANKQARSAIRDNFLELDYSSDVVTTVAIFALTEVTDSDISSNKLVVAKQGSNLNVRAIVADAACIGNVIRDNNFKIKATALLSATATFNLSNLTNIFDSNIYDSSSPMSGVVVIPADSNQVVLSNPNIKAPSNIIFQPEDNPTATVMATKGFSYSQVDGSATLKITGTATTEPLRFRWLIV